MEITYGTPVELAKGIRRLTCNNPSPLTGPGTNTFFVGDDEVIVIDPGPLDEAHLQAILNAAPRISHICVTHSHLDHSPLARPLAEATGAKVYGFGPSGAGTNPRMAALTKMTELGGGEGVDQDFTPDMGWASTLISPPHGDLTDFLASCTAMRARDPRLLLPAHGASIDAPIERIDWLIDHRAQRTIQILDALESGPTTLPDLTRAVYTELEAYLIPAAQRNVLAHLIDLIGQSRVTCAGPISLDATFARS